MSIKPYTIFDSSESPDIAFTPGADYDTGWQQFAPGTFGCVSLVATLAGTLTSTTLTLYGSGTNDPAHDGVQITTTSPGATGETLWAFQTTAPYVRVKYAAGDAEAEGSSGILKITRNS